MSAHTPSVLLGLGLLLHGGAALAGEPEDLAQARALFERNIQAIQDRDTAAYLACYRADDRLVRVGATGMAMGFAELEEGTPPPGSDEWPEALVARDLQVRWLGPGLVFGTYRYRVNFDGAWSEGISERLFMATDAGWRIAVTTAHEAPPETPPPEGGWGAPSPEPEPEPEPEPATATD